MIACSSGCHGAFYRTAADVRRCEVTATVS